MEDYKSNIFSGVVKMFNGQFGFIQYQDGDIFFHKTAISSSTKIEDRSRVSFTIEPSPKMNGKLQAVNLTLLLENDSLKSNKTGRIDLELLNSKTQKQKTIEPEISAQNLNIGSVLWYDYSKYFGVISANETEYFFRVENINNKRYCGYSEGRKCVFVATSNSFKKRVDKVYFFPDSFYEDFKNAIPNEELIKKEITLKINSFEKINNLADFCATIQLFDVLIVLKIDISNIVSNIYEKFSDDFKILLWIKEYTTKCDITLISKIICTSYGLISKYAELEGENNSSNRSYELDNTQFRSLLLLKLLNQNDHLAVLNQIILDLNDLSYYSGKYDIIKIIANIKTISDEIRELFFDKIYSTVENRCKYEMWKDGFIKKNDINILAENLPFSLSELTEFFIKLTNLEKLKVLNIALESFSINVLLNLKEITIFINSDFFIEALNSSNTKDLFLLLWYIKSENISGTIISEEFSVQEFVKIIGIAKVKDINYCTKIDLFYAELPSAFKMHLWLNSLYGSLDYIEFAKSFHELTVDDRKLFNKKVKVDAQDEQIKSFIDQVPTAELIEDNSGQKRYKCKWRNIYFNYQQIQVFLNKKESTRAYYCSFSRPELNLLTQEYFTNRRIDDIYVTVNNDYSINRIDGLESIETQIIFAEIRKNGSTETRKNVSNEEIIRMIHNVGERNKCIKFLNKQNSPFNVVDIQELVTEVYGGLRRDISFLYSLPDAKNSIYLVWESVEFEKSKATHIFKCKTSEVESYIDEIKRFLESTIHSRSKLNSSEIEDVDQKKKLNYFGRVIHDSKEYDVWEERMKSTLPFLR